MDKIIVMAPDELRAIIEEVLAPYKERLKPEKKAAAEHMTLEEAIVFLKESGFPTSKTKMYRLTSCGGIPHAKYGNKLVFSRTKLMNWALDNTIDPNDHSQKMVDFITHVRRKGDRHPGA